MNKITKEQENFLNECTDGIWRLNAETGLVDVDGHFNCSRMGLSDFMGIEFGNISGSFNCSNNKLVSLKVAPKKVGKSFYCYNNQLVSLEGGPQEVGVAFYCYNNKLVSLEGAPQEVGGDFYCYNNQLVSLEGAPQEVGGDFNCYNNKLASLEGAPKKVGWGLICDAITLRGCPIDLLDKIYFYRYDKSFILKDLLNRVVNGLAPEIYLKKML